MNLHSINYNFSKKDDQKIASVEDISPTKSDDSTF